DRYTQEFFIDNIGQDNAEADAAITELRKDHARQKLEMMIRYAQQHRCRRQMILDYFGERNTVHDCHCDVCRAGRGEQDDTEALQLVQLSDELVVHIRQMLSAIARLHGKFGVGMVADVLIGAVNEKTTRFEQLSLFGILKPHSAKRVIA